MTIDCSISSGSNPETAIGLPASLAIHSYGRQPITVETCPGPMNASSRMSGESRMARIAGMIVTWLQNTEKLRMPSALARISVSAVEGAVVSKPMAKNITCRSGWRRASFSASEGEYTMRTSMPRALCSSGLPSVPGTRIMSPNAAKITFGSFAIERPSSIRPIGSTHTGQPGPWISSMFSGRMSLRPKR